MTIAERLAPLTVPIDSITPHPENARRGRVSEIAASLKRFGQMAPIVVQSSTGFVIGGNHVFAAAKSLGWKEIAVSKIDVDDRTAKRILVALNRTSDLGEYDDAKVLDLLEQLNGYEGTGYSADDVDDLIARLEGATEVVPPAFKGGYNESEEEFEARDGSANGTGKRMREVLLIMSQATHNTFQSNIDRLRTNFGTASVAETVVEAVRREKAARA